MALSAQTAACLSCYGRIKTCRLSVFSHKTGQSFIGWPLGQERRNDAEEEEKRRRSFFLKGSILRAVLSNSFVFIMTAAGLRFIICQRWPQRCCHMSLVWLVRAVFKKKYSGSLCGHTAGREWHFKRFCKERRLRTK
jgi:hypothetical protein